MFCPAQKPSRPPHPPAADTRLPSAAAGTRCSGDWGGSGVPYLPGRGTRHPAAPGQRVPTSSVSNCAFSTACEYPWSTKNGAPAGDNSVGRGGKIIYTSKEKVLRPPRQPPPESSRFIKPWGGRRAAGGSAALTPGLCLLLQRKTFLSLPPPPFFFPFF